MVLRVASLCVTFLLCVDVCVWDLRSQELFREMITIMYLHKRAYMHVRTCNVLTCNVHTICQHTNFCEAASDAQSEQRDLILNAVLATAPPYA